MSHPADSLPPDLQDALTAAAVLETFDEESLAALLGAPAAALLARLLADGLAVPEAEGYRLTGAAQAAASAALDAAPARLRELYGRAARHFAARLAAAPPAGRAAIERDYIRHLGRRCEALIQQEPTALADEAGGAPLELLSEPAHRHLLRFYRGLGAGLQERYAAAADEFARLLAEPELGAEIRGRVLNSGATFARIQGDYERARDGYRESIAIWRRLGNRMREGLALMNQGTLSYVLQDYLAAQRELEASLAIFVAIDALHAQGLAHTNLGLLARDQGRWQAALDHFAHASLIFEREGAGDFLGMVANNIGEVELLRGDIAAAMASFSRALELMHNRAYAVDTRIHMGLAQQAHGDDGAALEQYQIALELATAVGRREILALIYYRIAHAEQRLGRLDAAQARLAAAAEVIEETRTPIRDEGLLINLMGRWQQVYEAAVLLCLARGDPAGAFDYAERARARAFADILARRGTGLEHARLAPATAREARSALAPGELLLAYFATGLSGPESDLLSAIPREAAGLRECLASPPRLLLIALTASGITAHECPLNPNMLQARSPYQADGRRFLSPGILRRCYDALIAPAAAQIAAASRLIVVPHGPLHHLPFAALGAAGQTLLDQKPHLVYTPSATVWLRRAAFAAPAAAPCPVLAIGFDGASGRHLRHTEAEAAAIARLAGGEAWRGAAGIRQRLAAAVGRCRWLHLACHGEFDLDDPLRSWLEIGPGERLSAAEVIADLPMAAELVVLSACRSGVSRVLRGDEPMGLVRAFLSAGARAVLVTLWPVEDTSARLLMERFYAALLAQEKADPAAALGAAQAYLRDLTMAELQQALTAWGEEAAAGLPDPAARPYADPAFWAAYALVGA